MKILVLVTVLAVASANPVGQALAGIAGVAGTSPAWIPADVIAETPATASIADTVAVADHATDVSAATVAVPTPTANRPRISMIININPAALESNLVSVTPGTAPAVVETGAETVNVADSEQTSDSVIVADSPADAQPVISEIADTVSVVDTVLQEAEPAHGQVSESVIVVDTIATGTDAASGQIGETVSVVDSMPAEAGAANGQVGETVSVVEGVLVDADAAVVEISEAVQVVDHAPVGDETVNVADSAVEAIGAAGEIIGAPSTSDDSSSITNNFFVNVILNFLQNESSSIPLVTPGNAAGAVSLVQPRA